MAAFNGLGMNMGNLSRLSDAKTRSISPENFTGAKGAGAMSEDGPAKECARDLGKGWKISPYVRIKPGETFTLADIEGEGAIQHIWLTPSGHNRFNILRIYWDGEMEPSVECPVGDFFACGWQEYKPVYSLAVNVNPGSGLNCYWEMPFRKRARVTMTNLSEDNSVLYYQIDYTLTKVEADAAYFHAQFRRQNPLPYKTDYVILDGVRGKGQFVGTYMAWGTNNNGWWGEGEIKFFLDGDKEYPTICGTGTEDYFCGSYCFATPGTKRYIDYTTPYAGFQALFPNLEIDNVSRTMVRFQMYRWHIADPIRFDKDLRVTIQALGWRSKGRYLPLQDDIASVAFWYQTHPHAPFPKLPDKDYLEII